MNIWHISDTHKRHAFLTVPKDIDTVIFSGDCSDNRSPYINEYEVMNFLQWFSSIPITNKVMIAGNHDTSIEMGLINKSKIEAMGITYLHNESTTIDGLKIWGSPYVPKYGDWAFMKPRDQMKSIWKLIPEDSDIVVTHGPAFGVLDLCDVKQGESESHGCKALSERISYVKPKAHLFGHIHNSRKGLKNKGIETNEGILSSNGSCVTDGIYDDLTSNGNKITIK